MLESEVQLDKCAHSLALRASAPLNNSRKRLELISAAQAIKPVAGCPLTPLWS